MAPAEIDEVLREGDAVRWPHAPSEAALPQQQQQQQQPLQERGAGSERQDPPAIIDLASVRDVDELIAMGTPRLKAALKARGMRTGGGAGLLAERLWWRCKQTLFADDSRNRIAKQKSLRPVGAYSTVQPTNLAKEKEKFLAAAADFEAGRRRCPPDDPLFEYAESDRCEKACPAAPCTCSRFKLWQDYGPADDTYLADALRIIQNSDQAAPTACEKAPSAGSVASPQYARALPGQQAHAKGGEATNSSGSLSGGNVAQAQREPEAGATERRMGEASETATEVGEAAAVHEDEEGTSGSLLAGLASPSPAVAAALAAAAAAAETAAAKSTSTGACAHGDAARSCVSAPANRSGSGGGKVGEEGGGTGSAVSREMAKENGATRLQKFLEKREADVVAGRPAVQLGENEVAIEAVVRRYLEDLDVADLVDICWMDPKVCASASMITCAEPGGMLRGKLHLVLGRSIAPSRLQSLLDHEIGTHFTRALNHHVRGLPVPGRGAGKAGGTVPVHRGLALRELITEEGVCVCVCVCVCVTHHRRRCLCECVCERAHL